MFDQTIIALDAGRSAFKIVAFDGKRHEVLIPTTVSRASAISDAAEATAAERDTVVVDKISYFCGETAQIHGNAQNTIGLSPLWIDTPEYRALCLAAVKRLSYMGVKGLENPFIVVGTPAGLYKVHRRLHEEITAATINGKVKAIHQPLGAYMAYYLDERGFPQRERARRSNDQMRSWGVIEIGHYTTDFLLIRNGKPVDLNSSTCRGMSLAVEKLMALLHARNMLSKSALQCMDALVSGSTMFRGKEESIAKEKDEACEYVAQEIRTFALNTYSSLADELDGILLAGGGAAMMFPYLERELDNVILLDNSRWAVAEGYLRWAKGIFQKRALEAKLVVENHG
jgi:plasmid segregation protein ParM